MKTNIFNYELPESLIAQTPLEDRAHSRLMVVDKLTGEVSHSRFDRVIDYLQSGDVLILNETKVLPARIFGKRVDTGGSIELLLLQRVEGNTWETLARPAKRAKVGREYDFGDGLLKGKIVAEFDEGIRHIDFEFDGIFEEILDEIGAMPLPPYIHETLEDQDRYQTIYARETGSAAAPTAGLHFTQELIADIEKKGVVIAKVTLHVGLGTFRPVKVEDVLEHKMHSEYYHVSEEVASIINTARANGNKIICTGTTSVRTIETVADDDGVVHAGGGMTDIFIYPGYRFRAVDRLITNFHLPESTLLMLVSALSSRENILAAYDMAVKEEYRFFSFGDAMIII